MNIVEAWDVWPCFRAAVRFDFSWQRFVSEKVERRQHEAGEATGAVQRQAEERLTAQHVSHVDWGISEGQRFTDLSGFFQILLSI